MPEDLKVASHELGSPNDAYCEGLIHHNLAVKAAHDARGTVGVMALAAMERAGIPQAVALNVLEGDYHAA